MAATPIFSGNFSTLSLWNGSSGTWDTNYWYNPLNGNGGSLPTNGEQEWYINANDPATSSIVPWAVQNGILTITGSAAPAAIQPLINGYQYVSGELNTYHSFSQLYGFFEARMELPAGQGLWPAFWMIPENGSWPPEIDIMEVLGNDPTKLYTSIHSGTASNEINGGGGESVADTSKAYHEFAVDWTPSTITWYFDNKAVLSLPTPSDMNVPMYLEINLAMGGGWPGNITASTPLPAQMHVANVQAYASNPNPITTSTIINADGTANQILIGAPGSDTFFPGTNSAIMTGEGLANTYIYKALPTASGQITDFDPGTDTIDLTGMLQSVGYGGSNPLADGTISVISDGHSGAEIIYNHGGAQTMIVELDNVDPGQLLGSDFVFAGSTLGNGSIGSGTGSGLTLTADNTAGQVLTATTPNDTFIAGQNSVVMTGDGGANIFVFNAAPWNAGQITNFNPASDTINVVGLLHAESYAGSNPFGDGTLSLSSDGNGGTNLYYNPPGAGANGIWPIKVVDIDHVAPTAINTTTDFILH
jgi:beta-glucanase (GH16 family)